MCSTEIPTTTTAAGQAMAASRVTFFTLPLELREIIYDLSLMPMERVGKHSDYVVAKWAAPSLQLVSRQVQAEYLTRASQKGYFWRFCNDYNLMAIHHQSPRLPTSLPYITRLEMKFNIYPARDYHHQDGATASVLVLQRLMLNRLADFAPNLRRIDLTAVIVCDPFPAINFKWIELFHMVLTGMSMVTSFKVELLPNGSYRDTPPILVSEMDDSRSINRLSGAADSSLEYKGGVGDWEAKEWIRGLDEADDPLRLMMLGPMMG